MSVEFKMASCSDIKKHNCPDCRVCQFCSDSRCNPCRSGHASRKTMSMAEQIDLYENVNRDDEVLPYKPLSIV